MRILVYEYLTGGGLWSDGADASLSDLLLGEGRAMVRSLSEDLDRVAGLELIRLEDARLSPLDAPARHIVPVDGADQESEQLARWSGEVDGVILIAPETDGRLLNRCLQVVEADGRLFSPDPGFVELTANKQATARKLNQAGIPTPRAVAVDSQHPVPAGFRFPAVLKPIDGAGSWRTRLVPTPDVLGEVPADQFPARLEQFYPGTPASIAVLCGPRGPKWLPPCLQRISSDGRFHYLGGELPLVSGLADRATRLARAALAALPPTAGYVGIDLILGPDASGDRDIVLDVNPRLTTSYVGLRQASHDNLAAAMLDVAIGAGYSLSFGSRLIQFSTDGRFSTSGGT